MTFDYTRYPEAFAQQLKSLLNMKHDFIPILFVGSAGTGKTTFARLLSDHYAGTNGLWFTLSDKRSTQPMDAIEGYCRTNGLAWLTEPDTDVKAKCLVLDELDNLQGFGLRPVMDANAGQVLFIGTVNTENLSRIPPSILDRFYRIDFPEPVGQSIRQDFLAARMAALMQ